MRVNPAYIQWIGDLIIPILGFLFWNWGLYFILLFILLDMFTKEIVMQAKAYHILKFASKTQPIWVKNSTFNTLLFVSFLLLVHVAVKAAFPLLEFTDELWRFWSYEDIGIQQGYVLLPLLAFSGYMQFKQSFVQTNMASKLTMKTLWMNQIKLNSWRVVAASTWIVAAQFFSFSEAVWVGVILITSALYQWFNLFRQAN